MFFKEKMIGKEVPYSKATAKKNPIMIEDAFHKKIDALKAEIIKHQKYFEYVCFNFKKARVQGEEYILKEFVGEDCWGGYWGRELADLFIKRQVLEIRVDPNLLQKKIENNKKTGGIIKEMNEKLNRTYNEQRYFEKKFFKYKEK